MGRTAVEMRGWGTGDGWCWVGGVGVCVENSLLACGEPRQIPFHIFLIIGSSLGSKEVSGAFGPTDFYVVITQRASATTKRREHT